MIRIAGVNLNEKKRLVIALTSIYGVGLARSKQICKALGFSEDMRPSNLTDEQIVAIRNYIDNNFKVEGDLRRQIALDIKQLIDIRCYRGLRHRVGLPVRGQRTRSNARVRKGKKKLPVANKK